jgi:hypothetical protein
MQADQRSRDVRLGRASRAVLNALAQLAAEAEAVLSWTHIPVVGWQ